MNPEACLQSLESFVKSAARHLSKFSFDSPRPEGEENDSESWESSDEMDATIYTSSDDFDDDEVDEEDEEEEEEISD